MKPAVPQAASQGQNRSEHRPQTPVPFFVLLHRQGWRYWPQAKHNCLESLQKHGAFTYQGPQHLSYPTLSCDLALISFPAFPFSPSHTMQTAAIVKTPCTRAAVPAAARLSQRCAAPLRATRCRRAIIASAASTTEPFVDKYPSWDVSIKHMQSHLKLFMELNFTAPTSLFYSSAPSPLTISPSTLFICAVHFQAAP